MNFRGVEKDDSDFIDISKEDSLMQVYLRRILHRAGFANQYDTSGLKNFRGVEKDDSDFIDISKEDSLMQVSLRRIFHRAGFANQYDTSGLKLLPCPRGTFVNIADTSPFPRCTDCPAGKLRSNTH